MKIYHALSAFEQVELQENNEALRAVGLQKSVRHESKKLRESARGRECHLRIPGVCNHNPETTVLCHLNGGGAGTKHSDLHAAFGCSACHDEIDGRTSKHAREQVKLWFLEGVIRTQTIWLDEGMVILK